MPSVNGHHNVAYSLSYCPKRAQCLCGVFLKNNNNNDSDNLLPPPNSERKIRQTQTEIYSKSYLLLFKSVKGIKEKQIWNNVHILEEIKDELQLKAMCDSRLSPRTEKGHWWIWGNPISIRSLVSDTPQC